VWDWRSSSEVWLASASAPAPVPALSDSLGLRAVVGPVSS
jgi:hypothetical protein